LLTQLFHRKPRFEPPALGDAQQRALDALRSVGVAVISFSDLFDDGAVWAELEEDMREFVVATERDLPSLSQDELKALHGKSYLIRRFRPPKGDPGGKRARLLPSNPWVRFGVSPQILDVVNAYRGHLVRLHDVDNWYTVPDPQAAERVASQRWHRDGWENHIVKVFTYFSDVDAEAGPFEYIRGSTTDGRYGSIWPWEESEVYPPQDELGAAIDEADCLSLTGPPGTIVICDTSGFHRGGFARTRPRILSYHTYLSDEAEERHKRLFRVDVSSEDAESLSSAARHALS
jgi:hypothetical protein